MSTICTDQKMFNDAFYKALEHTRNKEASKSAPFVLFYVFIHTIFLIWGVILAFKSQPPENRIVHITLAMLFAPLYVFSYYLNEIALNIGK